MPPLFKGKLAYAMLSAEITRAGLDARREDGKSCLVMWKEVVGAAARRLPPDLEGVPFVDIISTSGQTLRFLPWTRISGEELEGDGEARCRSLVKLVVGHNAEAVLDPATKKFVDTTEPPAQLPDLATLAAHDARLA